MNLNTLTYKSKEFIKSKYPLSAAYRSYRYHKDKDLFTSNAYFENEYETIVNNKPELKLKYDPQSIQFGEIEINKNCNLNCPFCKTQLSTRANEYMCAEKFEEYLLIAKRINRGKRRAISIHTIGEPLMNPKLEEYFQIARKHDMLLFIVTNALLFKKKLDLLYKYSDVIETLRFSVDGACKETYEIMREPAKFEKLIDNLNYFKETNGPTHYFNQVAMNSVVSTDNKHELAYHLEFYSQYVPMHNITTHLVDGLSTDNTYFFEKNIFKKHIQKNQPCNQLRMVMHVLYDGRVTACCRDYNADLVYGNLNDSKPEDLINNDKITALRQAHLDNNIPKDILCNSCYKMDERLSGLFMLFKNCLVYRHSQNWKVNTMQERFNHFFDISQERLPTQKELKQLIA